MVKPNREIALSERVTTQAIKTTIAHPEIHRIKEYLGEILIKLSYSEIEEILNEKGKMNQRSSATDTPEALFGV